MTTKQASEELAAAGGRLISLNAVAVATSTDPREASAKLVYLAEATAANGLVIRDYDDSPERAIGRLAARLRGDSR